MKVLHIITGLGNGGAEGVLYRLCAFDRQSGHQHHVISMMDGGVYAGRLESAGCSVTCLHMPRGRLTLAGLRLLYQKMRALQPDVVQTWMYHADLVGGVAARLCGIRAVAWGLRHADLDPGRNKRRSLLIARICARLSSRVPARIACCSEEAMRTHARLGYSAEKITVIPNGYALAQFQPSNKLRAGVRRDLGLPADRLLVGMVARWDVQKDHSNLLHALALVQRSHPAMQCLLVGAEMTQDNLSLRRLLTHTGMAGSVLLLGQRNDIPAIMNALDLHILSSAGEAFPNVLAEAMACGTPCVATDVGDASLIVGETGWLAPPRNAPCLAQAILQAISARSMPDEWEQRRKACRLRIAQYFELSHMVAAYHALWAATRDQPLP
ncbi:glycosyltransferase [Allopusillimonas soli]|uniref:Glycosyltransferase n=1 Tax=Allopusillimonas soli TaxID=659016 RepID=A0A853FM20_9BURK|nr:glycosyltransferase [Allopusillimonas soli]NYT38946.1 glycosyltransferase [Allopusillimonas soli]TEA70060.1 glycosyltransferase [Allopusillimonas soli]